MKVVLRYKSSEKINVIEISSVVLQSEYRSKKKENLEILSSVVLPTPTDGNPTEKFQNLPKSLTRT